jgi:glycosyltransferase involved in cell wall biosynthesis
MRESPLVSVFVPTFNQVQFVDEAIASAIDQDYEPLEVIVPDDGSTDGTVEAIQRWTARYPDRMVPLIGLPHVGVTQNCNRGLRACRGKYIAFSAGDDVLLPGKIAAQVEWMEEDPKRVLCGHDVDIFDSDTGETLSLWTDHSPLRAGEGPLATVNGPLFAGPSIMVRASALPRTGYDHRLAYSSDTKLWLDTLSRGGKYGYVSGILSRYRRHARNLSSTGDVARVEATLEDLIKFYELVQLEYPQFAAVCRAKHVRLHLRLVELHLRGGHRELAQQQLVELARKLQIPGGRALANAMGLIPTAMIVAIADAARAARRVIGTTPQPIR